MFTVNINTALIILVSIVALKAIFIGSDFSFYKWIKHGKEYTKWYIEHKSIKFSRKSKIINHHNK